MPIMTSPILVSRCGLRIVTEGWSVLSVVVTLTRITICSAWYPHGICIRSRVSFYSQSWRFKVQFGGVAWRGVAQEWHAGGRMALPARRVWQRRPRGGPCGCAPSAPTARRSPTITDCHNHRAIPVLASSCRHACVFGSTGNCRRTCNDGSRRRVRERAGRGGVRCSRGCAAERARTGLPEGPEQWRAEHEPSGAPEAPRARALRRVGPPPPPAAHRRRRRPPLREDSVASGSQHSYEVGPGLLLFGGR